MKVISNTILFVYSLRSALIEIVRVYHTRWRNFFPWNQPHYRKRSEGIQLRSTIPIIAKVTAIGTRTPSHECQEPITVNVYFPGPGCLKDG